MRVLHVDFESRSRLNLEQVSTARYASDATTEALCCAFALDDGEIRLWKAGEPPPDEIVLAAEDPDVRFAAHNAKFEFALIEWNLAPRLGWPRVPIDRFICTMAMSYAGAYPGGLDRAAAAVGLAHRKDKAGKKLMLAIATYEIEHPTIGQLERLYAYCLQDVEVERALHAKLPLLTEAEHALWVLDHKINQRGLPIDRTLAKVLAKLATEGETAINASVLAVTSGAIPSTNHGKRIKEFLRNEGYGIEKLDRGAIKKALESGLNGAGRKLLELCDAASHKAAKKSGAVVKRIDNDNRIRETLVFHGAGTGRWTGRNFQPQNLARPPKGLDIESAIAALKAGTGIEAFGAPLSIAANVSRGLVCAPDGRVLLGADYSAIESRITAWLAGEEKKLATYRLYDETKNPDHEPYCVTASKMLGRKVTPDDEQGRGTGKVGDLSGCFSGYVGAWRRGFLKYGIPVPDDAAIAALIAAWRKAHPRIVRLWDDLFLALMRAVRRPGTRHTCGHLSAECTGDVLRMYLPSGRAISYPEPRIVESDKFPDSWNIVFKDNNQGKWRDVRGWRGTFIENAAQGVARDIMAAAMMRLEDAGFAIVATVHDEIFCEIPEGEDRAAELKVLMERLPPWADGLPIVTGKPWCGKRFIKSDAPAAAPIEEDQPESEPMHKEAPPWEDAADAKPNGADHSASERSYYRDADPADGDFDTEFTYYDVQRRPYLRVEKRRGGKRGKQFPQYHWDGNKWVVGKPKGPKIPYRLPELFAAPLDTVIHIAEGEKDADTLAALGLVATTNAEGAKKGSWTADLNKWFVGRERVIIPEDNDDTGRAFAREKAKALEGIVKDIRIVSFPDVPPGEDVTYWIQELGHTKEEYLARCDAAPRWAELERVCAADVTMEPVTWFWPNRFAIGKLGIIAGLPDEGKGQLFAYIAARATTGGPWPMGEGTAPIGNVIYLQCEDGQKDTVVPRLAAAGADLKKVHFLGMVKENGAKRMLSLRDDLSRLRREILDVGNVNLLLIDPISAYMAGAGPGGRIDTFRTSDVRVVLGPLADLAEELMISALGIMHFNKKVDITNIVLRMSDSLAFGAAARHVYAAIDDRENGRKLFVRGKNNLANRDEGGTLAYRFDTKDVSPTAVPIIAPFIKWDPGYVDISATEAMNAATEDRSVGKGERARTLLRDLLAGGPIPVTDIEELAKAEGISMKTMHRIKDKVSARARKEGEQWFWELKMDK